MAVQQLEGLPRTGFLVGDDGKFKRFDISIKDLVSVDAEIKKLAATTPTILPFAATHDNKPVAATIQGNDMTLTMRLPAIKLATWWAVRPPERRGQKARQIPVFAQSTAAVNMAPLWTPPSTMALWFIVHFQMLGNKVAPKPLSGYLLATCLTGAANTGGTFRLPLPNIHDTGKICLGMEPHTIYSPGMSVAKAFSTVLDTFLNNRWNTDLINTIDVGFMEQVFAFEPDGTTQFPIPEDWPLRMTKVSNAVYNSIPFKELV